MAAETGMISSHTKPFAKPLIPNKRLASDFLDIKSVFVITAIFFALGCFAISAAIKTSPAPESSSAGKHIMMASTESML